MIRILFILCLPLSLACQATDPNPVADAKLSYEHPIPFEPATYICYRVESPLTIDGLPTEAAWSKVAWTEPFVDIEGDLKPKPNLNTQVKMLWDKDYFYFYAKLDEPHIWATLKQRDTVIFYDDDFEIFIDPDGDGHNYYELEVNAYNTLWDLILLRPYRADHQPKVLDYWNVSDIRSAIHIEGTLNNPKDTDEFWAVEMAVPWSALGELANGGQIPEAGDQWRVNFSRVDWTMDIIDGRYQKRLNTETGKALPENNWVWSPTGYVNMHMPEQWGYVQFTDVRAGDKAVEFQAHPDEEVKWALWQLYFQQRAYFNEHNQYLDNLSALQIPKTENLACSLDARLFTTPHLFEITANSCEQDGRWSIRQDGKIEFFKND